MCFSPAARFLILPALSLVTVTGMFAQSHSSKAWEALNRGLEDSNPAKRIQTIVAMSVIQGETQPVAAVEEMLNDKDSGVREAACTTLGEMRSRSTIPKLQRTLNDNAPEVAFAAAKALYAMGNATGREVLIAVVQGDQPDASGVISTSMREMRLKLHDPKALIRLGITQGAGFLGPFGVGVPIAERLMKDNQASGKNSRSFAAGHRHNRRLEKCIEAGTERQKLDGSGGGIARCRLATRYRRLSRSDRVTR